MANTPRRKRRASSNRSNNNDDTPQHSSRNKRQCCSKSNAQHEEAIISSIVPPPVEHGNAASFPEDYCLSFENNNRASVIDRTSPRSRYFQVSLATTTTTTDDCSSVQQQQQQPQTCQQQPTEFPPLGAVHRITPRNSLASLKTIADSSCTENAEEEEVVTTASSEESSSSSSTEVGSEETKDRLEADAATQQPRILKNRKATKQAFSIAHSRNSSKRSSRIDHIVFAAFLLVGMWIFVLAVGSGGDNTLLLSTKAIIPGAIYVEGGGFSGFWYTLGRLANVSTSSSSSSSEEPEFYCYSAGCLGVVSILTATNSSTDLRGNNSSHHHHHHQSSMDLLLDHAVHLQTQWQTGKISRFAVAPRFIDAVIPSAWDDRLSRVHIITTTKNKKNQNKFQLGLQVSVRTPHDLNSLQTLLRQTTWIPGATGDDLWYEDHMDGAFSMSNHPPCEYRLSVFDHWNIFRQALNVNLDGNQARYFWNLGLERGL